MSINALPNELIDLIVAQVGVDLNLAPEDHLARSTAHSDLVSLARVSKRFLQTAQGLLLYQPLTAIRYPSWTAAIQLVEALGMNGRALGKTVRSLEGVGHWFHTLLRQELPLEPPYQTLYREELALELPYQARGCSATFSWYLQLLRVCPRIQSVDLVFKSTFESYKVAKALAPAAHNSLLSISFVSFPYPWSAGIGQMPFDLVLAALETPELSPIKNLHLRDVSFPSTPRPSHPLVSTPLRSLHIEGRSIKSLAECFQAFPENSSHLSTLYLDTASSYPEPHLTSILSHLSPALQSLTILFDDWNRCPRILFGYPRTSSNHRFPLAVFAKFHQLTKLTLQNFNGPSLTLLDQLSTTSPLLTEISFKNSIWIDSRPDAVFVQSQSYLDTIVPIDKLVFALKQFKHLKAIKLGYLPTTDQNKYEPVRKSMREQKVEVLGQTFRRYGKICHVCQRLHPDEDPDDDEIEDGW